MRACQVLRPRRVAQVLALVLLDILPSTTQTASAPGIGFLSRLNGWPARSPADASPTSSRMPAHGSGPMWFAIPSSQWTCTTYSLPVSRRTRVKTLGGITAPGILGPTVMRRAKKRRNLSSARHYDQIRFRFHTAKTHFGSRACIATVGIVFDWRSRRGGAGELPDHSFTKWKVITKALPTCIRSRAESLARHTRSV